MPPPDVPIKAVLTGTIGYGQLNISATGQETVNDHHAVGLWALEGRSDQVNPLKAAGSITTAAIVAYSVGQAVWAESKSGPAVSGTSQSGQGL
jgi:hypothetical protein